MNNILNDLRLMLLTHRQCKGLNSTFFGIQIIRLPALFHNKAGSVYNPSHAGQLSSLLIACHDDETAIQHTERRLIKFIKPFLKNIRYVRSHYQNAKKTCPIPGFQNISFLITTYYFWRKGFAIEVNSVTSRPARRLACIPQKSEGRSNFGCAARAAFA